MTYFSNRYIKKLMVLKLKILIILSNYIINIRFLHEIPEYKNYERDIYHSLRTLI